MAYDVVIKNGTVVDGTGRQPYRADVAVQGDRIAEVGKITGSAKTNNRRGRAHCHSGLCRYSYTPRCANLLGPDCFFLLLAWHHVSRHGQLWRDLRALQTAGS